MASGKLTGRSLRENVLDLLKPRRKEVIVGANIGTDTASFLGEGSFCVHTDPITGATEKIGSLAIKVVLNDISAGFGEPIAVLLTLLLPESMDESDVKRIMLDAEREAENWNVEIIGGHTEFTDAVVRPVVNAVGIGKREDNYSSYKPMVGDSIIVTKNLALEGSFILAEQHSARLNLTEDENKEAKAYADATSVMREAEVVRKSGYRALMHDITEGGVLGASAELGDIENIGLEINEDSLPVSALTNKICGLLGVNPHRLISSGSMLIITPNGGEMVSLFKNSGIKATIIGAVTRDDGAYLKSQNKKIKIYAEPDELYRKIGD